MCHSQQTLSETYVIYHLQELRSSKMGNQNIEGAGYTLRHRSHPFYLGMSRHMADSCFDLGNLHKKWRESMEEELSEERDSTVKHCYMSAVLGFGRTAIRTPIPVGSPPETVRGIVRNVMVDLVDDWIDLHLVIFEHEVQIQDYIKSLSQEQLKDHLNRAWKNAKTAFNTATAKEMATPGRSQDLAALPHGIPFTLDQADMAEFHAPDLDNFTLDFLEDDMTTRDEGPSPVQGVSQIRPETLVPVYRTGCNIRDGRSNFSSGDHSLPALRTLHGIECNVNLAHFDMVRPAYLAPHINLQDLMIPENLFRFIHYRARTRPQDFAAQDNIMTYTGRQTKIVSGPVLANNMFAYREGEVKDELRCFEGYGLEPHSKSKESKEYHEHYRTRKLFGPSEFYVLLKSQQLTYAFLKSFCFDIARKLDIDPEIYAATNFDPARKAVAKRRAIEKKARQNLEYSTPWPERHPLTQYEPQLPGINVEFFATRLEGQYKKAEAHMSDLFNDPDYFADTMIQEREHHWHNIPVEFETLRMDEYHDKEKRHGVYKECLRRVSKRALFELLLWNTTKVTLEAFNQSVLDKHKGSDRVPELLKDFEAWPRPPSLFNHKKPEDLLKQGALLEKYMKLVSLIRYNAIFFVNEFKVAAIHASSEPLRGDFVRKGLRREVHINKGHFDGEPINLGRCSKAYNEKTDDKDLLIDLIDNFIADELASTHIGIHKVTERLQFLLEDPEDVTWKYMTTHVAGTIEKLHLLAELAEHLERWHPITEHFFLFEERARRVCAQKAAEGLSLDLFAFDSFEIDSGNCVPSKRVNRLCSLMDELQQFETAEKRHMGIARGDLKRYVCSLLKQYIVSIDERTDHRAGEEVLKRLESQMGTKRDEYPFEEDEKPLDVGYGNLYHKVEGGISVPRKHPNRAKYKNEARKWKQRGKKARAKSPVLDHTVERRNREEIVERRRVKMQARVQRVRDEWERKNAAHRAQMAAALAAQPAPQPPPVPEPQPQVQPAPQAAPSIPLAPDGQPKKFLKPVHWGNLAGLYGVDRVAPPSYEGTKLTLHNLGYAYRASKTNGSHVNFDRTDNCRWAVKYLPKGNHLSWSTTHGGKRKRVSAAKAKTWANFLEDNGLTWKFINDWHYGYE